METVILQRALGLENKLWLVLVVKRAVIGRLRSTPRA